MVGLYKYSINLLTYCIFSEVDDNVDFDSIDTRTHDEEEKYFDDEDSDTLSSMGSIRRQDVEEEEDYEMYEVEDDVRPGLIKKDEKNEQRTEGQGEDEYDELAMTCKAIQIK